jgi:hypothetical protein
MADFILGMIPVLLPSVCLKTESGIYIYLQTQENVWKNSRDFVVTARSSKRKWAVKSGRKRGLYNVPRIFLMPPFI